MESIECQLQYEVLGSMITKIQNIDVIGKMKVSIFDQHYLASS